MTPLDAEAEALRHAAACGDFDAAQVAAMRFTNLLQLLLAELPPAEAQRRLLQACELMGWARRHLCAARERIATEMQRLETLSQYHRRLSGTAQASPPHSLKVEG